MGVYNNSNYMVSFMKVLITSTEFEGLIKTGGLGDAISGICHSLAKLNDFEVDFIIPDYMNLDDSNFEKITEISIKNDDEVSEFIDENSEMLKADVLYQKIDDINVYLIDNKYYFDRPKIYGYDDDLLRWTFFSRAIYELTIQENLNPDVIHTNDYHEGLVFNLFKNHDSDVKLAITVHNAYFRGYYEITSEVRELFEYYINSDWQSDDINLLRESVSDADRIITVSQDYAQEIQTSKQGYGLEDIYKGKGVSGFVNGLDLSVHNRETDNFKDYLSVKDKYKVKLQKRFNLKEDPEIPLITYICRLGIQKGSDIVYNSLNNFIEDSQFILLGTGLEKFEEKFSSLNGSLDNYYAVIDFDSELAREMYIASDIFLMPSCFEPCGIAQLIAQHYACLPIVSDVGGLKETVIDYTFEGANGFKIHDFSEKSLTEAILNALDIYYNQKEFWLELMENAFNADNNWDNRIKKYVELYKEMVYN